jgi:hypothetical protein
MERIGAAGKIIDCPAHDQAGSGRNTHPGAGNGNRFRRVFIFNYTHRSRLAGIPWQAPFSPNHQGGRFGTLNKFSEANFILPLGREHWTQELGENTSGNKFVFGPIGELADY